MRRRSLAGLMVMSSLAGSPAVALNPGEHLDNFRLLDHRGASHELYYLSDMKALVLMVQQDGCGAVAKDVSRLNELRDQYRERGVEVLMLNPDRKATRESVTRETTRLGTTIPVLLDHTQLIGESLDVTKAGEVFVINPKGWVLTYRGPMAHVASALDATIEGRAVAKSKVRAKGCRVAMQEKRRKRSHAKISYAQTIAPLLIDKCVACHRDGGIAPWAMTNYEMVRGFAPMIREVVRTQRMPPWHADPHHGTFTNDRALSDAETKALVHWIEVGAPRGKGADPLAAHKQEWPSWSLGEPDLVVEIPTFNVPATGAIAYQRPVVKNPLGRDVWLRAIEMVPADRSVVHHILAGLTGGTSTPGAPSGPASITALGVYVPGDVPHELPKDTGVLIPKDADFVFQMHYTANGKPVAETTRVGLYFARELPKYPMRNTVLLDSRLKIPANTKEHTASVTRQFDRDVLIYTLMAHAHVRGKGAKFSATYPDGREEILLSVPHYDFNWQTSYELAEPKLLPKGTRLVYTSTYDNSSQNQANPDPTIEVRWGEQTWEEMIYGDVRFRFADETTAGLGISKMTADFAGSGSREDPAGR